MRGSQKNRAGGNVQPLSFVHKPLSQPDLDVCDLTQSPRDGNRKYDLEKEHMRIRELEEKLRAALAKADELEEECDTLGAKLACIRAEERHGNSALISKLQTELDFKQRGIEEANEAYEKERKTRVKIQSLLQDSKKRPKLSAGVKSLETSSETEIAKRSLKDRVEIPSCVSSDDLVQLSKILDTDSYAAFADEYLLERVLTCCIESNYHSSAVLNVLRKCTMTNHPSADLTHQVVATVLIPLLERELVKQENLQPALLQFLTELAQNTYEPCGTGRRVYSLLVKHLGIDRTLPYQSTSVQNLGILELFALLCGSQRMHTVKDCEMPLLVNLFRTDIDKTWNRAAVHVCLTIYVSCSPVWFSRSDKHLEEYKGKLVGYLEQVPEGEFLIHALIKTLHTDDTTKT